MFGVLFVNHQVGQCHKRQQKKRKGGIAFYIEFILNKSNKMQLDRLKILYFSVILN